MSPVPSVGEERDDFASRCIPIVISGGETDNKAAVGKCYGIYDNWKKKQASKEEGAAQDKSRIAMLESIKDLLGKLIDKRMLETPKNE